MKKCMCHVTCNIREEALICPHHHFDRIMFPSICYLQSLLTCCLQFAFIISYSTQSSVFGKSSTPEELAILRYHYLQWRVHCLTSAFGFDSGAMAVAATQLGMCASSFFCSSPLATKPASQPVCGSPTLVVCHQGNTENHTIVSSRRFFAVAAGFAATVGVFAQPQAAEAKRNKPPPEEKKVEAEDKSLSAYDARLLANARRKEAMKENIDKLKAKASLGTIETANSNGAAETAETAS